MLQYILRRLLLMLPTLFGITLVTFGIVHLMPGKPGDFEEAARKGVKPEDLEAQRRRYFLDLPLFLNFSPEDGPAAISKMIDRAVLSADAKPGELLEKYGYLLTEEEQRSLPIVSDPELLRTLLVGIRDRARGKLVDWGGAAIPVLFERFDDLEASLTPAQLDELFARSTRSPVPKPEEAAGAAARWRKWWEENQGKFTDEHVDELVGAYVSAAADATGPSPKSFISAASATEAAAVAELRVLGTFALARLIAVTQDDDYTDKEAGAAAALLADITQVAYSYSPDEVDQGEYEKIDRVIGSWEEWWRQFRREYDRFSGFEIATGVITETQYYKWVARVVTFEFGLSQIQIGRPVLDILGEAIPKTLSIAFISLFLAYLISVPIGVVAASKQGSLFDQVTTVVLFILYSLPSFWVALMLIQAFCNQGLFDWFPVTGLKSPSPDDYPMGSELLDRIWHMVLPVVCLTYGSLASLSRYQRVGMLDVVRQDYIRTARAKGLAERVVIWKHAVRNSLLPIITLLGLQIPFLVGGSIFIEEIFQINGMGHETFKAISTRDYPVVMAVTVLTAMATMLALLLSDILYALADPRISYKDR
jgi:peptide/nickel transport system permease protein